MGRRGPSVRKGQTPRAPRALGWRDSSASPASGWRKLRVRTGVQAGAAVRSRAGAVLIGLAARLFLPLTVISAATGPAVHKLQTPPAPPASIRIPLEPLGFQPPNPADLTYRIPSSTLDFVDESHLLFTFHKATLMQRAEQEPDEDEDQTIAALLLELPSGRVVERADWRMHDKGRYLWSLGHGRFLERERNTFYLVDKSLTPRVPYLQAPGSFRAVVLSPDRSRMLVEYQEKVEAPAPAPAPAQSPPQPASAAPTLGDVPRAAVHHKVRMLIVDTATNKVEKFADLANAITLPLVEGGYLEMRADPAKARLWSVLLVPFSGEPRTLLQLNSSCQPSLQPISQQVFLAQLCIPYTSDHLMQAYDLAGKKQWEQQWEARYIWPTFAYAENGSRFAYGSVQLDHAVATLDPVTESSITGQPVGVFDVADGTLRLVIGAQPILSAGQNYALSPDGEKFAVVRGGAIELYTLPPAPVR